MDCFCQIELLPEFLFPKMKYCKQQTHIVYNNKNPKWEKEFIL